MKVFLIAAVAVAVSGAAFAKELKQAVMSDAEMDKITAGSATVSGQGPGVTVCLPIQGAAAIGASAGAHGGGAASLVGAGSCGCAGAC